MKRKVTLTIITLFLLLAGTASAQVPARKEASSTVESSLIEAVALYDNHRYKDAKDMLTALAGDAPDNDAVFYYLGLCSIYTNDIEDAETFLLRATEIDPSNFWYRDWLARLYMATRRPELATEVYEGLMKDFPKNSEICYSLVNLYAQQGKSEKMLSTLDEIETVQGPSENVTMTRYQVLMRMDKPEEAFAVLEKFNEEYSSPDILAAMGDYKLSQYEDSLALSYYAEALSLDSDCGQALMGSAEAYRMRRSYPEYFSAMTALVSNESIALDPKTEYLTMTFQHADPQFLRNFRPQMDSLMTVYDALAPDDSTVLRTMCSYFYATARNDEALDYIRKDVTLNPESLASRALYIQLMSYAEMYGPLAEESMKAAEDFPDEPAFLEYATIAHYNLKDYSAVISDQEKLMARAPQDTAVTLPALSTMGDMYWHLGETKKAYACYDKALRIDPGYVQVLNNYAYFLSLEGKNLKKAYSMSRITVEKEPDNSTYLDTFAWILHLQGKDVEAKPFFKHAMLYGGKESATMLDHYAEVLYALGEYDLAKVYWNMAIKKDTDGEIPDLKERSEAKLKAAGK